LHVLVALFEVVHVLVSHGATSGLLRSPSPAEVRPAWRRIVAASQSWPSASRSRDQVSQLVQRQLGTVAIGAENDLLAPTDLQPEHHKDAARLMGFMPSLAIVTFVGSRFAAWTRRAAGRACSPTLDPTTTQRVAMGRLRGLGGEQAWRRAHTALHRDSSHPTLIVQCVCTFGPAPF